MAASEDAVVSLSPPGDAGRPARERRRLGLLFAVACAILAAVAFAPVVFGHGGGKDYPLWYRIGRRVLKGDDLYAPHGGHPAFAFLYPPVAALLLAPFSLMGPVGSRLAIVLVNIASWWAAIRLADRLSGMPGPRPWWVVALPSAISLPFIWDMFDLGQPNLMLLAMMLAGLALLQGKREWSAGAMFAAATALKAFPVAVLPYLIWRRRWRAAIGMATFTAVFLVLAPAPFRGFERNLAELGTWANGMVFSADEAGFGQRPGQNWSWKNNSLIAITHRYLRPVNAEAEDPSARPIFVNIADLSYDETNLVLLAIAGAIGVGFVAVLPPQRRRTRASDGAEHALVIALITVVSPLARAYYFVWLLFPFTVLVYSAALDPERRVRRITAGLIGAALAIFTVGGSFVRPHWPQALGNMFWATCVVIGALVWLMRRSAAPASAVGPAAPAPIAYMPGSRLAMGDRLTGRTHGSEP